MSYTGTQEYAFNPRTGASLWHDSTGIEGGGGATPVLANGDLFDAGNNIVLSASTGTGVGSLVGAASGGWWRVRLHGLGERGARDRRLRLGSPAWTFDGDSRLGHSAARRGRIGVRGLHERDRVRDNASTGVSESSANAGTAISQSGDVSQPTTGLGAGNGTLIVPAGNTLVAYAGANVGSGTPTNSRADRDRGA